LKGECMNFSFEWISECRLWHGVSGFEVVLISLLILTPTIFANFYELLVDFLKQIAPRCE
jgi:hypothetical protein